MSTFTDIFPPVEVALELEPEELAVLILEFLCRCEGDRDQSGFLNRYNLTLGNVFKGYCDLQYQDAMAKALMEGWV